MRSEFPPQAGCRRWVISGASVSGLVDHCRYAHLESAVINELRFGGYSKRWPINSGWVGKPRSTRRTRLPRSGAGQRQRRSHKHHFGIHDNFGASHVFERLLSLNLNDTITWIRKEHTFKFDLTACMAATATTPQSKRVSGSVRFYRIRVRYGYADFLLRYLEQRLVGDHSCLQLPQLRIRIFCPGRLESHIPADAESRPSMNIMGRFATGQSHLQLRSGDGIA